MHTKAAHLTDDELRRTLLPTLIAADRLIDAMHMADMDTGAVETLIELAQRIDNGQWEDSEHEALKEELEEKIGEAEDHIDGLKKCIEAVREALPEEEVE